MAARKDFYDILGVSRSATADELRAAHRRLARELHPDVNKAPDAAKRFAEVQEAYDVLSDDAKRRLYDQIGHDRFVAGGAATSAQPGGPGRGPRGGTYTWTNVGGAPHANPFDPDDIGSIFEEVFGGGRARDAGWGGSPSGGGGGGGGRSRARKRGRDVEHEISIPFDLALTGGAYTVRLSFEDEDAETIEVKVPRGVVDGAKLRLRGKGHPAPGTAGERGDLFLTIRVAPHPYFRREGDGSLDIIADVPISITEATLGAKVSVRTPGGVVDVTIPAATVSGSRLRLKGRGVEAESGARGDFYAVIKIVPPRNLSDDEQRALRDFGARHAPPAGDARA